MDWIIALLFVAGVFILIWYLKRRKATELGTKGRYVERDNGFFKQGHFFFTKTDDFTAIAGAIDRADLLEEKISFEPNIEQRQIVFHNKISFGTFGARLRFLRQRKEDGLYMYLFQVETWRNGQYGITRQDLFGANVLLTLIEKAFLGIDSETEIQRAAAEYKSKF